MSSASIRVLSGLAFGLAAGWAFRTHARRFSVRGRTVVITGGSRGLGLELAREFAARGARLALLARDPFFLRKAIGELRSAGTEARGFVCDVTDEHEVQATISLVAQSFGQIDVLINNAGMIEVGPLNHFTREDFSKAMDIHFFAPLTATLAVLPEFRRTGSGRIVNISSIGGKVSVPHLLPYSASKFALVGLSEGLRAELARENVLVTTVCPGLMRTGSPVNAKFRGRSREEYAWFVVADSLPFLSMNSHRAARKIVDATCRGDARLILGVPTKAAVLLNELFPEISAELRALVARCLPDSSPKGGTVSRRGGESESAWSKSFLTSLTRRAETQNNQRLSAPTRH